MISLEGKTQAKHCDRESRILQAQHTGEICDTTSPAECSYKPRTGNAQGVQGRTRQRQHRLTCRRRAPTAPSTLILSGPTCSPRCVSAASANLPDPSSYVALMPAMLACSSTAWAPCAQPQALRDLHHHRQLSRPFWQCSKPSGVRLGGGTMKQFLHGLSCHGVMASHLVFWCLRHTHA